MCSCHSILECCVAFSGVKLSIRSFVLFMKVTPVKLQELKVQKLIQCEQFLELEEVGKFLG